MVKKVAKKKKSEIQELSEFVRDHMATKEDIAELRAELRAEMATKKELQALDEKFTKKFREILLMTEGLMKPLSELKMEYTGMMIQLNRHG